MPLSLKSERILLPNNRPLALKRAMQLGRRFKQDTRFKNDYIGFMNEIIEKWAERLPEMELEGKMGRVNYVPHTEVYHKKKPDKIRIVFDCSAEFQGVSLTFNKSKWVILTHEGTLFAAIMSLLLEIAYSFW